MANSSSINCSNIHSILCRLEPYEDDSIIMGNQNNSMFINSNLSSEIQEIHDGSNMKEQFSTLNLLGKKDQQALDNTFNFQNMNVEEEFMRDDVANLDKDSNIEPIIEKNEDDEGNESFYHDNKNFIDNYEANKVDLFNDMNTFNINNNILNNTAVYPNSIINEKPGLDEIDKEKIRKKLIYIKYLKNTSSFNSTNSVTKEMPNPNNNKSVLADNKKLFNVTKQNEDFITSNIKLDLSSCQLSFKSKNCKRGRRQFLLSGIKTEILDKTFLREFKKYLKLRKKEFKNIFEEDPVFWNEFLENKNPPFSFTQGEKKIEFKSYNKYLMNFIFSKPGVNTLYNRFILETKGDTKFDKIFSKKKMKKSPDIYTIAFYKYYRQNLNKLYSQSYSDLDIIIDDLDLNNVSMDLVSNSFQ